MKICQMFSREIRTDYSGYQADRPYFKQQAVRKVWLNPASQGYNKRKVEMARVQSVDKR